MSFRTHSWRIAAAFAAIAVLAVAPALFAQQVTGNIYGTASDEQGARLPGVSITISGMGAPQSSTSNDRGEFRYLNLSPGDWTMTCELQGFAKVTKSDVQVAVGKNTNVTVTMKISTVEAAVTVRGEAAILDTRKVATGAQITQVELQGIPTARDPWVVLQSVPGVLTDRLNVGGNQSGQQSLYTGKGAMGFNNVWNLDGVNITDMAATGSTGTYYDFDSFEEINATTGGADITQVTPGVQLNLVTKRGTNDYHGSARVFLSRTQWQSQNITPELAAQGATGGSRIDQVQDYGVEVGGPIWKDRAWLWGAYGRNQVDLITIAGASDKTTLEDANLKLNLQLTDSTSANASYTQGDKIKLGRNVSASRPPEAAWNQSGVNGKPSALDKVEVSQVVSSKLFFTASYAYFRGGFQLTPVGGLNKNVYLDTVANVWHNSYLDYHTRRPSNFVTTSGSFFFNTGQVGNEFKFGFSYRKAGVASQSSWPGDGNVGFIGCFGAGVDCANLTRAGGPKGQLFYYNGYAGDVITFGNATINAGVRYDVQSGYNQGGSSAANPVIPDILPALTGANQPTQFKWKNWQPRVGITYAVGAEKKALLKASYARFADQLGISNIFNANANALAGIYYYWNDANGDRRIQRNEIDFASGAFYHYGFDPANPTSVVSPNTYDPNFKAGTTDEFLGGVDYEVLPEFVVGAAYTHRKYSGIAINRRCKLVDSTGTQCLAYLTPADFHFVRNVTGKLFDGTAVSFPLYGLNGGSAAVPAGSGEVNRPTYNTTYDGIELTWQKRLSNKWMVRGNFSWNNWKQHGGTAACSDPTNALSGTFGASCPGGAAGGSDIMVAPSGTGSGAFGNVFVNSRWNFNVSGLYELPWGFNIAANFYGREGYPFIQWITSNPGDGLGVRSVLATSSIGAYRHKTVFDADVRLEKSINIRPLQVNLSVDVFNVANAGTVLQRQGRVNTSTYNRITETLSPRIVRAGARISF